MTSSIKKKKNNKKYRVHRMPSEVYMQDMRAVGCPLMAKQKGHEWHNNYLY